MSTESSIEWSFDADDPMSKVPEGVDVAHIDQHWSFTLHGMGTKDGLGPPLEDYSDTDWRINLRGCLSITFRGWTARSISLFVEAKKPSTFVAEPEPLKAVRIVRCRLPSFAVTTDVAVDVIEFAQSKTSVVEIAAEVKELHVSRSDIVFECPVRTSFMRIDSKDHDERTRVRFEEGAKVAHLRVYAGFSIICQPTGEAELGRKFAMSKCHMVGARMSGVVGPVSLLSTHFSDCSLRLRADTWHESDTVHESDRKFGRFRRQFLHNWAPKIEHECTLANVVFDHCLVDTGVIANHCADPSRVKFLAARSSDRWESLRDNYTGSMMALHLGLTCSYLAMLLTRVGFYSLFAYAGRDALAISAGWQQVSVLQLLLFGFNEPWSPWGVVHLFTTVVLLFYNAMRILVTVEVTRLRAREDHLSTQGFTYCRPHPSQYRRSLIISQSLRLSTLAVVAIVLFKIFDVLRMEAWAPIG